MLPERFASERTAPSSNPVHCSYTAFLERKKISFYWDFIQRIFFPPCCAEKKNVFFYSTRWLINWPMRGSMKLKTKTAFAPLLSLPEALHLSEVVSIACTHNTPPQHTLQWWLELFWNVNELLARTSAVRYSGHDTKSTHEFWWLRYDIYHHHKHRQLLHTLRWLTGLNIEYSLPLGKLISKLEDIKIVNVIISWISI